MSREVWVEIGQAEEDGRHELHLNGDIISDRLKQSAGQLHPDLFKLESLNYLEISDTTLTLLPQQIGDLKNLINLALHRNHINTIPESINKLEKLKFFDLSSNKITSLPDPFHLSSLHTFNLGNNGLESLPDFSKLTALSVLFIDHNKLTELPTGIGNVLEVHAANNQIGSVTDAFKDMQALKCLDLSENALREAPVDLTLCRKLKELNLKDNPFKDNRFKKLTTQCSTKAILDYISKQSTGESGKKKGKGKKTKADPKEEDPDERKIRIIQIKDDKDKEVISTASVKESRPYICCTVIKQLDLREPTVFKSFITLQVSYFVNY